MGLFKTVSAGGQTWAHGMRMTRQVIRIIVLISLAAGLSSLGYFLYQQPKENYKAFYYLTKAKISLDEKVEVRGIHGTRSNDILLKQRRKRTQKHQLLKKMRSLFTLSNSIAIKIK